MIQPTVGRIVHYYPNGVEKLPGNIMSTMPGQPLAADLCAVHNERLVNLCVKDANGLCFSRTSVTLVQEGDKIPDHEYCTWMPYQLQTAKAANIESDEGKEVHPDAVMCESTASQNGPHTAGAEGSETQTAA